MVLWVVLLVEEEKEEALWEVVLVAAFRWYLLPLACLRMMMRMSLPVALLVGGFSLDCFWVKLLGSCFHLAKSVCIKRRGKNVG